MIKKSDAAKICCCYGKVDGEGMVREKEAVML